MNKFLSLKSHVQTLLVCGFALLSLGLAHACPKNPPSGLKLVPVGDDMVLNGVPLSAAQFQLQEKPEVLMSRVSESWKQAGHKFSRKTAAGWDILSSISEDCMVTLQIPEKHASFGYFAVSRPKSFKAGLPSSIKQMSVFQREDIKSVLQTNDSMDQDLS